MRWQGLTISLATHFLLLGLIILSERLSLSPETRSFGVVTDSTGGNDGAFSVHYTRLEGAEGGGMGATDGGEDEEPVSETKTDEAEAAAPAVDRIEDKKELPVETKPEPQSRPQPDPQSQQPVPEERSKSSSQETLGSPSTTGSSSSSSSPANKGSGKAGGDESQAGDRGGRTNPGGSGGGSGAGGGGLDYYPAKPRDIFLPPVPPAKIRGFLLHAVFDVDTLGRSRLRDFSKTSDSNYNKKLKAMLEEIKFLPARNLDGSARASNIVMTFKL